MKVKRTKYTYLAVKPKQSIFQSLNSDWVDTVEFCIYWKQQCTIIFGSSSYQTLDKC
jgi:hypothetical protein